MKKAFLVVDCSYGDAGKGATVDALTRKYNSTLTVRFCGGPQAAHNVILPDGKHHTFAQFGAGTLAGAYTYLSKYMLIEPMAMLNEAMHLQKLGIYNPFDKMFIDPEATIITPYHILANRIIETYKSANRSGSCGLGIGETMYDKLKGIELKVKDLFCIKETKNKLWEIFFHKIRALPKYYNENTRQFFDKFSDVNLIDNTLKKYNIFINQIHIGGQEWLDKQLNKNTSVIFEGSQGMLIDDKFGFAPFNTFSNVSFDNALELLKDYDGQIIKLGLTRSYMARHGPGPFVTEDENLQINENHNQFNQWQREFRVGDLDLVALKYSIKNLRAVDYLVVNHCDFIQESNLVATGYEGMEEKFYSNGNLNYIKEEEQQYSLATELGFAKPIYETIGENNFLDFIQEKLDTKIAITANGPTYEDRKDLIEL